MLYFYVWGCRQRMYLNLNSQFHFLSTFSQHSWRLSSDRFIPIFLFQVYLDRPYWQISKFLKRYSHWQFGWLLSQKIHGHHRLRKSMSHLPSYLECSMYPGIIVSWVLIPLKRKQTSWHLWWNIRCCFFTPFCFSSFSYHSFPCRICLRNS